MIQIHNLKVNFIYSIVILLFALVPISDSKSQTSHFDHAVFDKLLNKYVNNNGKVDYTHFADDRKMLRQYLNSLSSNAPDTATWSNEEQIAYWLNLYNAFTTELILDHYPLESIRDLGTKIPLVFGESAWDIEFIHVTDRIYTLDAIEKEILKNNFDEPRVHFALVCAASSCPNLRREAYTAEKLESQLNSQVVLFLSNSEKNNLGSSTIKLSKIFDWYNDEFTRNGTLIEYINQFSRLTINEDATIEFIPFDWSLNGVK